MHRRGFLATSGVALTALSAGCAETDSNSEDEERTYTFRVNNGAFEPHSFRVRVGNKGETWFHEESFDLTATTGSEEIALDQTPSRLFVTVDSNEEREFPWPASMSELGTAARKTDIWYEPTLAQDIVVYGDA